MAKILRFIACSVTLGLLTASVASAEVTEVRLASQFGLAYLPLMVMEQQALVQEQAKLAGLVDLTVKWTRFANASAMNDALLSGNLDFSSVGPAPLALLWGKTHGAIKGVAAYCAYPLYLDTRNPNVHSVKDFTNSDRIAVPAIKVSGQALLLEMTAAATFGYENYTNLDKFTVSMSHPDALTAMVSGVNTIDSHFNAAPYHQLELRLNPAIHTITNSYKILGGKSTPIMLVTSQEFHDANPKLYAAVLAALGQAVNIIRDDKAAAARLYVETTHDKRNSVHDILKILDDPDFEYTLTPMKVFKWAQFEYKIGRIPAMPNSWKDLFFSQIHNLPGD